MRSSTYYKTKISMKFYGKHNNAAGRDPDFGAIFMSNSATKGECLQRRLFGLPSSQSQFVKQVKAGMILFLFEHEERELHGVYKSCCDGGMNIVPDAFGSSGKQFPAQVKFIPIWDCRPLSENIFRDAIIENYFSANKFNFGLSENQVYRLLSLFNKTRLEPELSGRRLIRIKDVKPECYPVGKVGRSVDGWKHVEIVKNEEDAIASNSPFTLHNYLEDSFQYNGEVDDIGFNRSDIVGSKHGGDAEPGVDYASGYVSDYLALKDNCRFTGLDKEYRIGNQFRPTISGGISGNLSDEVRVHKDDGLRESDKLMKHMVKPGQRLVFLDHIHDLHNSEANLSFFSSKPMLEPETLVQNQLRPTSAMLQPIQAQISDNSCAAQAQGNLLHDPDAQGFDNRQSSYVRIRMNDSSKSTLESASPSNNYGRNSTDSLNNQRSHMHIELDDTNRFQNDSYGLVNHVPYGTNRTSMSFYAAQNPERFAAKPVVHEGCGSFPLKYSSVPLPLSDIGNSGWASEPFSSLYCKYNSCVSNDDHPIALQENLGHEVTLQKNNETCSPVVIQENEGHSQVQYGDLIHEHDHDIECYGNFGSSNSGYKKKNSVFSRISFVQGFNNRGNGSNNWHGEYDVCTSNPVNEVMEMVRRSQDQWMMKRKLKPLVKHKAESLSDKKQIASSRLKRASFEMSMDDTSMDTSIVSESKTDQITQGIRFVDFKRRSHVRKSHEETEIRGSNENSSEKLGILPRKKRKLIRPNFGKSTTTDDKGINLGSFQNLQVSLSQESSEPKDDSKSFNALVQNEKNIKIDVEEPDLVCQRHIELKSNNDRGCVEGVEKARDGGSISNIGFYDGLEFPENSNNLNASSSVSCQAKSSHKNEGLCVKDYIKLSSPDTESLHSTRQVHKEEKVIDSTRDINFGEGILKDGRLPSTIEVKDGSESSQNSAIENAPIATILEDGRPSFTIEFKYGFESSQNFANENAPITTCEKSNYEYIPVESSETFAESSERDKEKENE